MFMSKNLYIPRPSKKDKPVITPWNRFYKFILMNKYDKTKRPAK